ncbi:uncharacterized protein LOC118430574 isoform X1 [Branchiostoma floridae]|uniref:Uncharacterized protein LOC118430574 isoform X1 n=1 Tax=Branchiostoma floridae TaxID=7739 RepID=C3ZLR8_BRAFL|nr:uncharacterized protein LOC118430574 isoform X1 [Branchiostoma floridae]XP_035697419.1 uncharacterized protein LOC118430574 isoform X1 [Branchiostoma floridae]XP_035697420.1 uncharacterized protein LOC118430574 isoform X1 [Branchiostoma floridae]|eukprot:XP_002590530.1 hypothetical protein BRAFLDRAFT_86202 [Branchiostoma floridae]
MQLDSGWVAVCTMYLVHLLPDKATCFPIRTSPMPTGDSGIFVPRGVWMEARHRTVSTKELMPTRLSGYSEDIYFEPTDKPLGNGTDKENVTDSSKAIDAKHQTSEDTSSGDYNVEIEHPSSHIPRPPLTGRFDPPNVRKKSNTRLRHSHGVFTSTTGPTQMTPGRRHHVTVPRSGISEWERSKSYDEFRHSDGNGVRGGIRLKTTATSKRRTRGRSNGHDFAKVPPRRVVRRGDILGSGYYEKGLHDSSDVAVVTAVDETPGTEIPIKATKSPRLQTKDFQCPDDYCENNGICTVIKGQPRCACLPTFAGDRCQEFVGGMIVNFSVNEPVFASVRIWWEIDIRYPISGFQLDCYMQGLDYEFKYSVQLDAFTRNFTLEGLHPDVNYRACVSPIADGMVRAPVNFDNCKDFSISEPWVEKEKRLAIISDSAIWILLLLVFLTVYAASRYCRQW